MKSDSSKSFPYLVIVAIVAIVGIVVLVWSAKSPVMMSDSVEVAEDDSALAGEAGASCTDNDPTNAPYSAGQVVYNGHTYADLCSANALTQYYCLNGRVQQVSYRGGARTYFCPNGCSNGACLGSSSTTCTNSCQDGSHLRNFTGFTNGDCSRPGSMNVVDCTITQGPLSMCGATGTNPISSCLTPNCANGACASACTDSDGGNVVGVAGTSRGYRSWGSYESNQDRCDYEGSRVITEWYCDAAGLQVSTQNCPSGKTCQSGACV